MTSTPPISSHNHPAHTLLTRAHPPDLATKTFNTKLKKPLLLTPTITHDATSNRTLRRKTRAHKARYHLQHAKPRPLSAKEKRALNLHDLKDEEVQYSIYKSLNELWQGYILEVLGFTRDGAVVADAEKRIVSQSSHGSLLASADFHGMEIEVVRCTDPGRVGLRGIVVKETKGSIMVVTRKDQKRVVLKRGAVFRVVIGLPGSGTPEDGNDGVDGATENGRKLVFELHGSQLEVRPVERAIKQFKWKAMDFL